MWNIVKKAFSLCDANSHLNSCSSCDQVSGKKSADNSNVGFEDGDIDVGIKVCSLFNNGVDSSEFRVVPHHS